MHQQYQAEHEAPVHYEFSYAVNDEHTGDIKSQQESRNGDAVQGHYELIDSDGFKRIVDYTADDVHGFNAVVRREPTHIRIPIPTHVAVSHVPTHYASAAPIIRQYSPAPVQHLIGAPSSSVVKPVAPVLIKTTTPAPIVHYQAPVQQHYQPAPVQHYQPAPVQHYQPTPAPHFQHSFPVQHVQPAPVQQYKPAPQNAPKIYASAVKSHAFTHEPAHVTFLAPGFNYNY